MGNIVLALLTVIIVFINYKKGFLFFEFKNFLDYNAKSFNGTKKIIFSNSTSLGNSSSIGFFLVFGGIFCIFIILIILLLNSRKSQTEIDFTELKWE